MKKAKAAELRRDNFLPGAISADGFLGADKRTVSDIIRTDEAEMERLGLSFEGVAASLGRLMKEGKRHLGGRAVIDRTFSVVVEETRGRLPCPFEDFHSAKSTAVVTRLESGRALVFTDLSLHLLATHHFLQGRGSPFRLEPRELKDVLGL
jgi:hypothetical protein